jgi:hypothetical protein
MLIFNMCSHFFGVCGSPKLMSYFVGKRASPAKPGLCSMIWKSGIPHFQNPTNFAFSGPKIYIDAAWKKKQNVTTATAGLGVYFHMQEGGRHMYSSDRLLLELTRQFKRKHSRCFLVLVLLPLCRFRTRSSSQITLAWPKLLLPWSQGPYDAVGDQKTGNSVSESQGMYNA